MNNENNKSLCVGTKLIYKISRGSLEDIILGEIVKIMTGSDGKVYKIAYNSKAYPNIKTINYNYFSLLDEWEIFKKNKCYPDD